MNQLIAFLGVLVFVASCGGSVDPVGEQRHVEGMGDASVISDAGKASLPDAQVSRAEAHDAAVVAPDAGRVDAAAMDARAPVPDAGNLSSELALEDAGLAPEPEPEPVEEPTDAGSPVVTDAGRVTDAAAITPLVVRLAEDTPPARIITPAIYYPLADYVVSNESDVSQTITVATLQQMDPDGDWADFSHVAIDTPEGQLWSFSRPSVLADGAMDGIAVTAEEPLMIAPHASVRLTVRGWAEVPLASATANGAWHGVARSGHTPRIQLVRLETLDGPEANIVQHLVPFKILRNAHPVFVTQPPPSVLLVEDVSTALHVFRTDYRDGGRWGAYTIVQFAFMVDPEGVTLRSFQLFQGTTMLTPGVDIYITDDQGRQLAGSSEEVTTAQVVYVRFNASLTLSGGSRLMFALRASPVGVQTGARVITSLAHLADPNPVTGYVGDMGLMTSLLAGLGIDTSVPADGLPDVPAGLLWSDRTELPAALWSLGTEDGSRDWTNESYVDLGSETILTATP